MLFFGAGVACLAISCGDAATQPAARTQGALLPTPAPAWFSDILCPDPLVSWVAPGHDLPLPHPSPGARRVEFPVHNTYRDAPGCYVDCKSAGQAVGMVRMPGCYLYSECVHQELGGQTAREVCAHSFSEQCADGCEPDVFTAYHFAPGWGCSR